MSDLEYIVLTKSKGEHLVCIRRASEPEWLQVLGSFTTMDRAQDYADIENQMHGDEPFRDDEKKRAPKFEAPPSGIAKLNGYHIPLIGAIPQPPQPQSSAAERSDTITLPSLADEILASLPLFMKTYDGGPTIRQVAMHLGAAETDVRAAFKQIERHQRAVLWRAMSSAPYQLAPLGFEPPAADSNRLTDNQAAVLRAFTSAKRRSTGEVITTIRELSEASGVPMGSVNSSIFALEKRGLIKALVRVKGVYQVLEGAQA